MADESKLPADSKKERQIDTKEETKANTCQ